MEICLLGVTRRQVQNESWAAEGDRKVVSREGHGSSGPLLQTAAHEWPSFCMTLLLNTNASFFFSPFGRQSSVTSVRARTATERDAMWGMSHQQASEHPTGMLPEGRHCARGETFQDLCGSVVPLLVQALGQNGLFSDLLCRLFTW